MRAERASIERAAKREMVVLNGINHPGIVRVDSMESHEAGPALIFRHDPALCGWTITSPSTATGSTR